jgi:hypothetical protein
MTEEFLASSSVAGEEDAARQLHLPVVVAEALGDPDQVIWMIDRDSGHVYVTSPVGVTVK